MKQQFFLSLLILLIINICSINSNSAETMAKPTKAASFITHFLRNFNVGKSKRSLRKIILEDCPKLKKSKLVRNIRSELYRMHVGLKRLNKAKINASRLIKRKINRIKRLNVLTLIKSILKRIAKCVVTPWKVKNYINNVVRKMRQVAKGRCNSKLCSQLLGYTNIRRMTKAWAYLVGIGRSSPKRVKKFGMIKEKKKKSKSKKSKKPKKQHKYDWPRHKVQRKDYNYLAEQKRRRIEKSLSSFNKRKGAMKMIAGLLAFFVKVFNKLRTI